MPLFDIIGVVDAVASISVTGRQNIGIALGFYVHT